MSEVPGCRAYSQTRQRCCLIAGHNAERFIGEDVYAERHRFEWDEADCYDPQADVPLLALPMRQDVPTPMVTTTNGALLAEPDLAGDFAETFPAEAFDGGPCASCGLPAGRAHELNPDCAGYVPSRVP